MLRSRNRSYDTDRLVLAGKSSVGIVGKCKTSIDLTLISSDQSEPEINPLRDENVAGIPLDNHAEGVATSLWFARHAHEEAQLADQRRDSALGASIAETATAKKAVTSDTDSRSQSKTRRSHLHDARSHTATTSATEDMTRASAVFPVEELPNLEAWRHLRSKRLNLQGVRVVCKEQREQLRVKQQELHAIDAQFVAKLYKVESVALEDMKDFVAEILKHFEMLEAARSSVAFEEDEYEKIERKLMDGERELRDLESRLYRTSTENPVGALRAEDDDLMSVEEDPTESVVSSQNIRRNQSVEAQRYLSQQGDVDILREQLMDLRVYQSQSLAEQADRRDAGLDPDEDLDAFLNGFEQQHEALIQRVREAEERLAQYLDALQVPDDRYTVPEEPPGAQPALSDGKYFDKNGLGSSQIESDRIAAAAEALFLSQSDSVSAYSLLKSASEDMPVDKALYVNSWLLHYLRSSTDRVVNLVAEHKNYDLQLEPEDFKREVLAKWLQDETVHAFDFSRFANDSHDYSIATVSSKTHNSRPASENALQNRQQNSSHLQRRLSARQTETER